MDERSYLITMLLAGIFLTGSLIYLAETTDAFKSQNNTVREEIQIPIFEAIPEQTIDCRLCHIHPENLTRHINGGNYCAACHGTLLHSLHIKDTTSSLTCNTCHGSNQAIPEKLPGHPVICDACHGYPDPLQPSYGNIITIHITRGFTCDVCHVQDIQSLHAIDTRKFQKTS